MIRKKLKYADMHFIKVYNSLYKHNVLENAHTQQYQINYLSFSLKKKEGIFDKLVNVINLVHNLNMSPSLI